MVNRCFPFFFFSASLPPPHFFSTLFFFYNAGKRLFLACCNFPRGFPSCSKCTYVGRNCGIFPLFPCPQFFFFARSRRPLGGILDLSVLPPPLIRFALCGRLPPSLYLQGCLPLGRLFRIRCVGHPNLAFKIRASPFFVVSSLFPRSSLLFRHQFWFSPLPSSTLAGPILMALHFFCGCGSELPLSRAGLFSPPPAVFGFFET